MHSKYAAWYAAVLGLSVGMILPRSALAVVQTLNPSADTFVSVGNPGNNYGGAGALEVSSAGLSGGEFQTLMMFNLASTKAGFDSTFGAGQWTLQSASLKLTSSTPNNSLFNANAAGQFGIRWMQNDSWAEGTGSPNLPTTDGVVYSTLASFLSAADQSVGTFNSPGTSSGSNTFDLDLPSNFVSDIENGGSVSLRVFAVGTSASYLFNSRSFGTVASRPLLSVTAVPVPEPVLGAAISGIALLVAVRRKRSRNP